jgi:hypothetical protein
MDATSSTAWWHPRKLFREENMGLLLDATVLVANLLLMGPLVRRMVDLVRRANAEDADAMAILAAITVGMFVLMPMAALLKRHGFHRRRGNGAPVEPLEGPGGCLFTPAFLFCLQVVVFFTAAALLAELAGGDVRDSAGLFFSVLFGGIVLIITSTVIIYRYFSPPKRAPRLAWLATPAAERIGDICLFANMLCWQTIWNLFAGAEIATVGSVGEFVGRLGMVVFLALLVYFPPRLLYLAEDIHRARTWVMIGLANAPVVWRLLIGTGG